jgi:CheY-like chemotaxis protein
MTVAPRVMLVASDLFFVARIGETARAAGVALVEVGAAGALGFCRSTPLDLVILDLHGPGDPIALARAIKSDPASRAVPIVAFYSHVERDLGERARAAGIEQVLPRSAFTVKLPSLLAGLRAGG